MATTSLTNTQELVHSKGILAPLIANAWYVIARAQDIDRTLKAIKVIGTPLVMYRTEEGEPVVLDDRCAHRRFPLSQSRLVGDSIQCRYHGFTYEKTGACIYAPGMSAKPNFGVRRYPTAERGPWLWVWMGNPGRADPANIPMPERDRPMHTVDGYIVDPANYMLSIENLLDVTHVHFLHSSLDNINLSEIESAETPPRSISAPPDAVAFEKTIDAIPAGPFAAWCGQNPAQLVREKLTAIQNGPSYNRGTFEHLPLADGDEPVFPQYMYTTHCTTPADAETTHHFWELAVDIPFAIPPEVIREMAETRVFSEDQEAFQHIQKFIDEDDRDGIVEAGIPTDRFGIKMRQILHRMKAAEEA